jgi:hypothetical protein
MTPTELIRMFVLNEIGDDFEDLAMINSCVAEVMARCGLTLDSAEVSRSLHDLMTMGFARAYRLSPYHPNEELDGVPTQAEMEHLYFYATEKGAAEHNRLDPQWPFDSEIELLRDWIPPEVEG